MALFRRNPDRLVLGERVVLLPSSHVAFRDAEPLSASAITTTPNCVIVFLAFGWTLEKIRVDPTGETSVRLTMTPDPTKKITEIQVFDESKYALFWDNNPTVAGCQFNWNVFDSLRFKTRNLLHHKGTFVEQVKRNKFFFL
jgi:hypothetical protein